MTADFYFLYRLSLREYYLLVPFFYRYLTDKIIIAVIFVVAVCTIGVHAVPNQSIIRFYKIQYRGIGRIRLPFEAVGPDDLQVLRLVDLFTCCSEPFGNDREFIILFFNSQLFQHRA